MNRILSAVVLLLAFANAADAQVVLQQVISREHPNFDPARAKLAVGKDGLVYLAGSGPDNSAHVLRMTPAGENKFGGGVTYALANAAANKDGVLATANGHFAHKVALYDRDFKPTASAEDFLVGDKTGWDAPSHVEAGESGDFYAADKHRDRILRISPQGKVLGAFAVPREPEGNGGLIEDFRVSEKRRSFYLMTRQGPLRCVDFDGKTRWTTPHRIGISHLGTHGGYDLDADGNLYVIPERGAKVAVLDPDGKPLREITLQIPDFSPSPRTHEGTVTGLQIAGDEILLKRWDATKLFERFDRQTGEPRGFVPSDHERLAVRFPQDVWTAGETLDFEIQFHSRRESEPQWRVWLRPLHHLQYRELKRDNGKLIVPADLAGLYQWKVTCEAAPWERGGDADYLLRGIVEVRKPGAVGSLSVLTPENRVYYGRGEAIPLTIIARTRNAAEVSAEIRLRRTDAEQVLAKSAVKIVPGEPLRIPLTAEFTRALRPGTYEVVATARNLTSPPCIFVLGAGSTETKFQRMRHGDYGETYPSADVANAADVVAAYVERERKLGFNSYVDRIGTHLQIGALGWNGQNAARIDELAKRLNADIDAVPPESAQRSSPLLQTMAAYSAHDLKQTAILLYMDAGLPLGGPGFDSRKPEQMAADLQKATTALLPYPAFRGWSWHSNWWIYNQRGSAAATSPEEKAAYEAAVKAAKETGAWSPVLDQVSERRLNFAVEAQEFFKAALEQAAPNSRLITASAGTYRNVESYPPISFRNVDEVDLQGQFEQIFVPYFPTHAVDFYRRPGKPVWGHPEIWNDAGTGEQILPELFSMLMRSPDGIGPSGVVPPWTGKTGLSEDPRVSHFGTASVFRALNQLLERYGAWIGTLETDDRVAIIASPRQFKIDEWGHVAGRHFARLLEAYVSCLHAHHPASIVFVDDLKPETLARFKAVILVDQWAELEPELTAALARAKESGVKVFYDATCRETLMQGFTPLGVAFDKFDKDRHPASDDAAYFRFPQYVRANTPAVKAALDAATTPAAGIDNPEVWASQLKGEDGRYLFVVNNSSVPLEPSQMWRTSLHIATLLPVTEQVRFTSPSAAVYDVFAMKKVELQNNAVTADLRDLPARLYALLPAEIASLDLRGPKAVAAGQAFQWRVTILGPDGKPLRASVPLRVRLLDAAGRMLEQSLVTATSAGVEGTFALPLGSPETAVLEATELLSGKTSTLAISAAKSEPLDLLAAKPEARVSPADATSVSAKSAVEPGERDFGLHLRDIVLSADGSTAVMNAMNHTENLLALDTTSGKVQWRTRLGHYFAFAPQSLDAGFAVQGFDYNTAEGYHLYLTDARGVAKRRFALHGLPRRLPHRFVPGLLNDRDRPVNNFAVPNNAAWVAASGNLGTAVWDSEGRVLWTEERTDRVPRLLAAASPDSLLTALGMTVQAHLPRDGRILWRRELAATGTIRKIVTSRDGRSIAVLATTEGGRIFFLQDGKLTATTSTAGEDLAISADGARVVAVDDRQLKAFARDGGLLWTFAGDDRLRNPRLNADGSRVAVGSELGTVFVLDATGRELLDHDTGALAVPAWLPDGDLLLANWMGKVQRLDRDFRPRWTTKLSSAADRADSLTAAEKLPTARVTGWDNAAPEPWLLKPNLLTETKALIKFVSEASNHVQFKRQPGALVDGEPEPPQEPWLDWGDINGFAESNPETYLLLDTFRTQLRVTGITFVEDPSRPDSWLRDASLEYWDAERERWTHIQPLLSDSATHTHLLKKPVEAARFRVMIPRGFVGNLRLAEIVLHGAALGASHPDVVAKRPVAVLFDDSEEFKNIYPYHDRWSFQLLGAHSGGRFLQVNAGQNIAPTFYPVFGHTVPNWDFRIVEDPQPGEYRFAQWSWKALSPDVKGATVQLGGLRLHTGEISGEAHLAKHSVGDVPPQEWKTVRVDLWKVLQKPLNVQTLYMGAIGGPVGFDRIILGKSEADLDAQSAAGR